MKHVTVSHEAVTPKLALEYLAKSEGNRPMKSAHIAGLVAQMRRGEWVLNGSSIVFDASGRLLDGHHRLMAVSASGCTVPMQVVRGVDTAAVYTMDVGSARTMADHLAMHGGTHVHRRASYLTACARLLSGTDVPIRTIDAYQAWEPIVHDGTEAFFELGLHQKPHTYGATVAAPLVLAHKLDPEKLAAFMLELRDGANLKAGSAVHTLREFLVSQRAPGRAPESRESMAQKVCAAVVAHLEGRRLMKLQASVEALELVRKAYNRGNAAKLVSEAKESRSKARAIAQELVPGEQAA